MKNLIAALVATLALGAGAFTVAAPASAVVRDDGAHHARHAQRDDGPRHQARHNKRDDGRHHARHTQRDDGPRHR